MPTPIQEIIALVIVYLLLIELIYRIDTRKSKRNDKEE